MTSLTLPVVYVTRTLLDETARLLGSFAPDAKESDGADAEDAAAEGEGVVYWFGLELGERAMVTTLVVPDADTTRGSIRTSAAANAEALSVITDTPLVLLGQAHSHPWRRVAHSWVDDRDTFAQFPGAMSVVVPFYGRRGIDLSTCGVHRHLEGYYRRIPRAQITEHLRVVPGFADFRKVRASV